MKRSTVRLVVLPFALVIAACSSQASPIENPRSISSLTVTSEPEVPPVGLVAFTRYSDFNPDVGPVRRRVRR